MRNQSGADYFIIDLNGVVIDAIRHGDEYTIKPKTCVERDENYIYLATEKIGVSFTKVISGNVLRFLMANKSMALPLLALACRVQPRTNILVFRGKRYGATHLAKDLKISRQMAHRYMKQLKDLGVIKEIEIKNKQYLVANPYLFHKSNGVMLATKLAFKEKQWQG